MNTEDREDVAVFWDFETSPSLSSVAAISTYEMVKNIRSAVGMYGPLKSIKLYWDYGGHPFPSTALRIRSEFSASGVSLIDCPSEGRKGAAIKKMLVDMLCHAWDSPLPPVFVVITGDRDVAYALALLRMKSYRVVLISPAGSHPDLTSQAAVQLDWSRTILGIDGASNEDGLLPKESRDRMPSSAHAPARSSSSSRPGQEVFAFRSEVPVTTLRDIPVPANKPTIFSSPYNHGFNIFGGPSFSSPKSSLGLGDPLFPRPQSANHKPLRSRSGSLTELPRPPLANKGKNKAPEPEDIEPHPQPPTSSRSRLRSSASIFEPFDDDDDDDDGLPMPRRSPVVTSVPERAISSNSSGSQQSKFSFEQISKPTGVNPADPIDQRFNGEPAQLSNEPRAATATASSGVQQPKKKTEQLPLPPVDASTKPIQTPKATKSQKASPQLKTSKPKPAKPLPHAWVPLIQTLRKHNSVLPKSTIAPKLLEYYPDAFQTAGSKNIKSYLKAAISAGIVLRYIRANGTPEIHLALPYLAARSVGDR